MDIKNGIKYAFIDFENVNTVQEAFNAIQKKRFFGMNEPLQVRLRFDKMAKPFFEYQRRASIGDATVEVDRKSIHLSNLPHNINKVFESESHDN